MKRIIPLALIILVLSGCAATRIGSSVDAQYLNNQYERILIYVGVADIGLRQEAEMYFAQRLEKRKLTGIPSSKLFFSGRQYSDEETSRILSQNGVDSVLILEFSDGGTTSVYIPETTRTTSSGWISGNSMSGSSTTRTSGGYNVDKPWVGFSARFIEGAGGNVIWVASTSTGGNAFAGARTLVKSLVKKVINRMVADGVIR